MCVVTFQGSRASSSRKENVMGIGELWVVLVVVGIALVALYDDLPDG